MDALSLQTTDMDKSNYMPIWGSYLYQNVLGSTFSSDPEAAMDWLISPPAPTPTAQQSSQAAQPAQDYFGLSGPSLGWSSGDKVDNDLATGAIIAEQRRRLSQQQQHQQLQQQQRQSGGSSFYSQQFYYNPISVINTSLLTQPQPSSQPQPQPLQTQLPPSVPLALPEQVNSSESITLIDQTITRSPTPSPSSSRVVSPHGSPIRSARRGVRGGKKRSHSMHSLESDVSHSHDDLDHHHDDEQEPEVPEGVERDGMIWGMKVDDYRALSARERKRVRNRISARTFRAKRKEHLNSLEHTLGSKDLQIKIANDEANRLRREVIELKRRLGKYEKI